jgi:hypothetical protein
VPAAVADGVVQRCVSNRATGRFYVGATVEERLGHIDVVAAGCPVRRDSELREPTSERAEFGEYLLAHEPNLFCQIG